MSDDLEREVFEVPEDPIDASTAVHYIHWAAWASEYMEGQIGPANWNAVGVAIESGLDRLNLTFARLQGTLQALRHCASDEIRDHVKNTLEGWVRATGTPAVPGIVDVALAKLENSYYYDFAYFVEHWPFLKTEPTLIDGVITRLVARQNRATRCLGLLHGTREDAERLHRRWLMNDPSLTPNQELARAFYDWSNGSAWGQFQYCLWSPSDAKDDGGRAVRQTISDLVDELRQLPLNGKGLDTDLDLLAMSPHSRAAWRRALRRRVDGEPELCSTVLETVLWLAQNRADEFALFTVLELVPEPNVNELKTLIHHPAHVVRLRATAALELATGVDDAHDLVLRTARTVRSTESLEDSRTWIGDRRIETVLESAFSRAVVALADEMRATVDSGEETHVAILFERLRSEAEFATRDIARLASEAGHTERVAVSFERRIVGRAEEGKEWLLKGRSFSTDICLVLSARRKGKLFAERATFLQAKRLTHDGRREYYKVDLSQMADLSAQTPSSFLLLVGPLIGSLAMPVIPARLVVEWSDASRGYRRIVPEMAARLGRSLAPWLVSEVVGLWTGDYSEAAVEKARGTETGRPTTVFELSVDVVPVSGDDFG
ncbi:hypothetical protein IB276_05765 [Ensifer sp. ENS04]|uniref:hypothetical protein n=1 Tax=Ensifer sp. ENS04 TaxID=2769281 RepID=UPI0017861186|nr:hypothetical protein [Ensifer sp. ENS04]MBD9538947.1 hypothetical protein [Ensifer sp. ENS04]